ncbi:MAG: hypothetical protein AB1791_06165 [Chloroflexota bacterium]
MASLKRVSFHWFWLCLLAACTPIAGPAATVPTTGVTESQPPAILPTPFPTETTIPTPTASSRPVTSLAGMPVQAMQLVAPGRGWALTDQRLWWTNDNGQEWFDVTPAGLNPLPGYPNLPVTGVYFLDVTFGWLVTAAPAATSTAETPATTLWVYATADGGLTWQSSELATFPQVDAPTIYGGGLVAQTQFLDTQTGWVLVNVIPSMNTRLGELFQTADGGLTWQKLTIPMGGQIRFASPAAGWATLGPTHWVDDQFFATQDSGLNWSPVRLDIQAASVGYDRPVFFDPLTGVLPVRLADEQGLITGVAFYATQDGGQNWGQVGLWSDPAVADFGLAAPIPSAISSLSHWVIGVNGTALHATYDGGQNWQTITPNGLTAEGLIALVFADETNGWALGGSGACLCHLFATADGGQNWTMSNEQ